MEQEPAAEELSGPEPDITIDQGDEEGQTEVKENDSPSEWDLDTDDVRSISSTELHSKRPNRWRGPTSTWSALTEQDRLTYEALVSLRNQDLAEHLYRVFALKQRQGGRRRPPPAQQDGGDEDDDVEVDIDMVTGQPVRVRDTDWVLPKSWTAWPMRAHLVPAGTGLMPPPVPEDAHEKHTLRRSATTVADGEGEEAGGSDDALEELVCATMLRIAKDRFRRRQLKGLVDGGADLRQPRQPSPTQAQAETQTQPQQQKAHDFPSSSNEDEDDHVEDEWAGREPPSGQGSPSQSLRVAAMARDPDSSPPLTPQQRRDYRRTYTPAFSADDERSYALLRPAAQRILADLDRTLLRLHEARVRSVRALDDASEPSATENEGIAASSGHRLRELRRRRLEIRLGEGGGGGGGAAETKSEKGKEKEEPEKKRKRGRPRGTAPPKLTKAPKPEYGPGGKQRRGRPRKELVRLPGESERDMLVRVAKERHERMPVFAESDDGEGGTESDELSSSVKAQKHGSGDGGGSGLATRGRRNRRTPAKTIPRRDGETEQEYLVRVARERHLKKPVFTMGAGEGTSSSAPLPPPPLAVPKRGGNSGSAYGENDEEEGNGGEKSTEQEGSDGEGDDDMDIDSPSRPPPAQNHSPDPIVSAATAAPQQQQQQYDKAKLMSKWPLRDWSDVVGAAALAGFPPSVVARTAQRCANLFGQGMELHTFNEVPADGSGSAVMRTRTFLPTTITAAGGGGTGGTGTWRDMGLSSSPLETDSDEEGGENSGRSRIRTMRMRSLSRGPSVAPLSSKGDGSSSDEDQDQQWQDSGGGRRRGQEARARARSRSVGVGVGAPTGGGNVFYCPNNHCPRAVEGFARRANMERHVLKMHGEAAAAAVIRTRESSAYGGSIQGLSVHDDDDGGDGTGGGRAGGGDEDVDSIGEIDGAVHVDGFLKPIKIRKGWRAVDARPRVGRKTGRRRGGRRGDYGDGEEERFGDSSS